MMSGTDSKKNEKSIKIFQVSGDKENKINIGVNEKFMLMIRSNITTGYSWSPANIDQIKYLKFLGFNEENCSDKTKGLKGGPSYECLLFQSLLPGKTVIILNLSRPWEKDQEPIKQIKISLMIR